MKTERAIAETKLACRLTKSGAASRSSARSPPGRPGPPPPPPELLAGFQPAQGNTVHGAVFDMPKSPPAAVPAAVNE